MVLALEWFGNNLDIAKLKAQFPQDDIQITRGQAILVDQSGKVLIVNQA